MNTKLAFQRIVTTFKMVGLGLGVSLLLACTSVPASHDASVDQPPNVDKFEGFNRAMFGFNDTVDRWLLKPVAKGYDWVMPSPVKTGVGNFFDNLGEVGNIVNDGLQWKWKRAAKDSGRFLMNSTVGVLGVFDVASKVGLAKSDGESFTQTLATWGVARGPYLVLPLIGPTTVRGGVSFPVDWALNPVQYVESTDVQIGANVLSAVNTRAGYLESEKLISGDRYLFIREAYLQRLEFLESDGEVEDDFGDDDFGDSDYDF